MLLLIAVVTAVAACAEPSPTPSRPVALPATASNATFHASLRTASGAPLRLYLDSGGGGPLLFSGVAAHVAPEHRLVLACGRALPFPTSFLIFPDSIRKGDPVEGPAVDGVLGGSWFDGHVWTWDYPRGRILLRANSDVPHVPASHVAALGFQSDKGRHTTGFARIAAEIDGRTYQFLLDTGAHSRVVAAARAGYGFPAEPFATNFIDRSIVAQWHRAHPDWPYVPHAEIPSGDSMIQVPSVTIGGYRVGPAWFTARADVNFDNVMSRWMDLPIVGSIGGETLRHFRLTIDYNRQRAYFQEP